MSVSTVTPQLQHRSARAVQLHSHACQHHQQAPFNLVNKSHNKNILSYNNPTKALGSNFVRRFHLSIRAWDQNKDPSSTHFVPPSQSEKQTSPPLDEHIQSQHKNPIPPNTEPKARMLIGFTCTVCQHRSHKTMSKHAYNHGVVIMQCDHCKNRHLIADHLGWFKNGGVTVEDLVKEKGETVQRLTREYQLIKDGGVGHGDVSSEDNGMGASGAGAGEVGAKEKNEFELALEKAGEGMLEWIPKDILEQEAEKVKKSQETVDQSLKKD
ncbi:Threonine synthase-like 1 [Podila epicladia]|nr:Threonine synthase-like 1 [Podila epicladia]KAG0100706.1 Threonine synthase-like 1 [Podila epicladia]